MEDSKNLDHHDEFPDNKINKETTEIKNEEQKSISNINNKLNEIKDSKINTSHNNIDIENNQKDSKENKREDLIDKSVAEINKFEKNNEEVSNATIQGKPSEGNMLDVGKDNLIQKAEIIDKVNNKKTNVNKLEDNKKNNLVSKLNLERDNTKNNQNIATTTPVKAKTKPVKEPPIEKKPFLEFVNDYLIPEIKNEFNLKGKEVNKIYLQKTNRPITEDLCWVIYCEIKDTCNFWLSFEKDDITSLKSFSLCKKYEKPSIIESFLIDEKKITLKLIISRILQRLNGQKLIGAN